MATAEAESRIVDRASDSRPSFSIICLSRQDWDARLPTNRQQIMTRAAARGHQVLFVETGHFLGTRAADWLRGKDGAFVARLIGAESVEPGLSVRRSVNVLPWGQRFGLSATVNHRLTARAVSRLARSLPRPVVLWIYDPVAFRRQGDFGEDLVVYDVVDDYAEQAGPARYDFVAAADRRAGRDSQLVFATTTPLRDRHLSAEWSDASRQERRRLRSFRPGRRPLARSVRPRRAPRAGARLRRELRRFQGRL